MLSSENFAHTGMPNEVKVPQHSLYFYAEELKSAGIYSAIKFPGVKSLL